MVRDEHALIMNYLKAQMAAEQRRDQAEDAATARAAEEARAAADAKLADALFASQATAQQSVVTRGPARRRRLRVAKPHAVVRGPAPHAPLTIAQADALPSDTRRVMLSRRRRRCARAGFALANKLIAKTLDIKDHVVAATRHVVSVIGQVFASVGDSIGGAMSGNRQFNSAS